MKKMDYVIKNLGRKVPTFEWLSSIEHFFGKEETEKFCEYLIHRFNIKRKEDIRTLFTTIGFSLYSVMKDEQIAFISIYNFVNTNLEIIKNKEDGFKAFIDLHEKKRNELSKKLKKLGYSYEQITGNWKDKNNKDTYQREHIFVVYSENVERDKFINDMCNLSNKYNKDKVLITDEITDGTPLATYHANIYDSKAQEIIEEIEDITIGNVEKYLSDISDTKFLFKIPYEHNKKIIKLETKDRAMVELTYYSKAKQDRIKKMTPYSCNSAMLKSALIDRFGKIEYNWENE